MKEYDAVCITIGAREARDLPIEGRELSGIHQALDYLTQQNKTCAGDKVCQDSLIAALDKNVLVIGGGDTGSDCVGTANRQGARKVTQIELLPMPSKTRTDSEPWPLWPRLHKTSSSHEEGCERLWCISSKKFIGENGKVKKVLACKVEWVNENGRFNMKEVPGSEFEIEADLVLLAMGFVHVVQKDFVNELGLKLDARGNIDTGADFKTSVDKVFAAGDANRGASLVVYAISEGRGAANAINEFLSK
jgi:glutamate synthase (NADPH/NADH) small chain